MMWDFWGENPSPLILWVPHPSITGKTDAREQLTQPAAQGKVRMMPGVKGRKPKAFTHPNPPRLGLP